MHSAAAGSLFPRGHFLSLAAADPDHDGDDDSTPQGDTDHDYWSADGQQIRPLPKMAASGLPQVQQVTDPHDSPAPQDDQLPEGVAFPLGDSFGTQWRTTPGGAVPQEGRKAEAARSVLAPETSRMMGHADALDGRPPKHKNQFGHSRVQHGRYLGGWNGTAGLIHGLVGRAPMSRDEYGKATGRPDLHAGYLASYAEGRQMHASPQILYRSDDEGQVTASRRTAPAIRICRAAAGSALRLP